MYNSETDLRKNLVAHIHTYGYTEHTNRRKNHEYICCVIVLVVVKVVVEEVSVCTIVYTYSWW